MSQNIVKYNTITELNNTIKNILEQPFTSVEINGEISNIKISGNNMYAILKDINSSINVICWNYKKKNYKINNGDKITIHGKIMCFSKNGSYNLQINSIKNIGVGDLHKQYEELKNKYLLLGYFNDGTKKQIPKHINNIGILTAYEGAALQDILHIFKNNKFIGNVIVKNCLVQGTNSPTSIANGLNNLINWNNNLGEKLDAIIITRGGGSFDDLISFSSEQVIEAIYNSPIYTISAVGHEIDYMLSDFVADYRAATPSISAEFITKLQINIFTNYNLKNEQMLGCLKKQLTTRFNKLNELNNILQNQKNKIKNYINNINIIGCNLKNILNDKIKTHHEKLNELKNRLGEFDIQKNLKNGYAVVTDKNNNIINSIHNLKNKQKLKLKLFDGEILITTHK